jgi:cytochrome bd-type quinol oxidase subunit 2
VAFLFPSPTAFRREAAAGGKTLRIMFIIACLGMPLVLTYTFAGYWTFRRRVQIGPHGY